jgi:TolB-like protein
VNPKKILLTFVIIMLLGPSLFAETKKMRIAIMDFTPKGISVKDARIISEIIRNDMINTREYVVVERDQMNRILYEQGFQMTGCTDESCAVEAGKLLSANKMLVGSISKLEDRIIVTGRIVDVEKGSAEFSEKVDADSMNDLAYAAEQFVKRLTDRMLGKTPEPERKGNYYRVRTYGSAADTETYQNCGYASLAFAIGAVASVIPMAVYQSKYSKAKTSYNSNRSMAYMDIAIMGASDPFVLVDILGMKSSISDMKKNMRGRDYSLYALAGFGGMSVVMAIATLGTYLGSEYAFLDRAKDAPFAVYPSYYCEPSIGPGASLDHHFDVMMRYRF